MDVIRINPSDNVCVAIVPLAKGAVVEVGGQSLRLLDDIPAGHKIALKDFKTGEQVVKYGFPIGHAIADVCRGGLMDHRHIATNLQGKDDYSDVVLSGNSPASVSPHAATATFDGFLRNDGQVGVRNELWVIPTVGCVDGVVRRVVERFRREVFRNGDGVDDVVAFPHNYGCSQLSDDHENTRRILRDMVQHPNAGGVLVVGLGCENNQPREFREFCEPYDHRRVRFMICQEVEGDEEETAFALLNELYEQARRCRRTPQPLSALKVGLKCGGSDGFSGITANPLLGVFSDWLCMGQGGTTVLTEVPEMFGAERILMERCANDSLLRKTVALINDFKDYYISHGEPVGKNPSPGNMAGGISTLEEKSLGCTQKAGSSAVRGVLAYGERIGEDRGLQLLSAPGNDLVASTALAAAGCQIVLFTTGRGTPFATFVPTMKISTTTRLATQKAHWIDFNAGTLLEGEPMESLSERFRDEVIAVASGKKTKSEQRGYAEIAIFKNGVTL